MSTLTVSNVTAGYADTVTHDRHHVLADVSLSASGGTTTAILGPNGVGKSTLLNVCLGWIAPWSGRVIVDTRELASISGSERGRLLSLVPQSDHVAFDYSILEYVLLGRAPHLARLARPTSEDVEIARAALARVGLIELARHSVQEISAGERQLVLVARALAQDPAILLLDEPTAHLDLANKRRLIELLRAESDAGRTVVFTVHEPDVAVALADQVFVLRGGAVLASGPPGEVLTSEMLSEAYGTPVRIVNAEGRRLFLW